MANEVRFLLDKVEFGDTRPTAENILRDLTKAQSSADLRSEVDLLILKNQHILSPTQETPVFAPAPKGSFKEGKVVGQVEAGLDQVSDSIAKISASIQAGLSKIAAEAKNYRLDAIEISLGLKATTTVGLIVAGITAEGTGGIKLSFKRVDDKS